MPGNDQAGLPSAPRRRQQRPLTDEDRALLHRVLGVLEGAPEYAQMMTPGLRDAVGTGTRDLTALELDSLRDVIRPAIEQWEGPRLPWEPTSPAWALPRGDMARLGLVYRAVSPPPVDDPDRPVAVNAADWAPPPGIPDNPDDLDDWVIANAPQPVQGPASARSWQGELRHGEFYAAWPLDDDDDAFWQASGAREVLVFTNAELAATAGRYLAACGLLPGEAGLTATEVARGLDHPWKDGVLDDEQVRVAALAAIVNSPPREDEHLAYDGWSDGPQRRELGDSERAFLRRLISLAAADPRFASGEIVRRSVIRAVLGDGTGPQARPLTARERDDIGWLVSTIRGEWVYARERPGAESPSPWAAGLPGGDIARLKLIDNAITPRRGDRVIDDQLFVNAADWAPPEPVPEGWAIGSAPVPISGPLTWQSDHLGQREFYAAAPTAEHPFDTWHTETDGAARPVKTITDEAVEAGCYAFLGGYGCAAPEQAGITIAEVARDLGYPFTAAGAEAANAAATATYVLRGSRANGDIAWYAIHGAGRAGFLPGLAAQDGYQVAPAAVIPFGDAPPGANEMADLALSCGWDLVYTNEKSKVRDASEKELMALNSDTGEHVSRLWDAQGRLVKDDGLEKITASPRPLYMPAGGQPIRELLDPVACGFPEDPVAAPRQGGRAGSRRRAAGPGRRAAGPGRRAAPGR